MSRLLAPVLTALFALACGDSDSSSSGSGGTGAASTGGTGTGGSSTGGIGTGGSSTGGTGTGATSAGGTNTGGTGTGAAGGSAGATGGTGGGVSCPTPAFVTSDPNGGWSDGGYYVHNNMWNNSVTLGPETLYACSYHNWYVVSNQTNEAGAVKTYPNVHKDYNDVAISSFKSITSTFAATSPHVGIYNVAFDIWINGVAATGSNEIMIWTENYNQVPAGNQVTTVTLGGRSYDVWKTSSNHYIAFVPSVPVTSGSIDLLEIFTWTTAQGWLVPTSTLGQICYGVEVVSTNGADATFDFTDFSISDN